MAHDDAGHSHSHHTDEANDGFENKLPVIILTGYLGAGKTTLLNHLLTEQRERRLAVIENEVGEVSIDDALVEQKQKDLAEELVVLDNGCVCCTIRGDLVRTLHNLAAKRKEGLELDGVLIELTGAADPAPVVQTFLIDAEVRDSYYVDNVIALVDAKHGLQKLEESQQDKTEKGTACAQIAFASTVLLNKIDLVSSDELDQLEKHINEVNSSVDILKCEQARVQVDRLLGVRAFNLASVLEEQYMDEDEFNLFYKPKMDRSISNVGVRCIGALNMFSLELFLDTYLEEEDTAKDFFRVKGVMDIKGDDHMFVIQCVHMLRDQSFTKLWEEGVPRENRIIFIGRGMEKRRKELTEGFLACVAKTPRFEVGRRVLARTGPSEDDYTPGTILKQWDEHNTYRIKLFDGGEVHAPVDSDCFVKEFLGSDFPVQVHPPASLHTRIIAALFLSFVSLYSLDVFSPPCFLCLSLMLFRSLTFNARLLFHVCFLALIVHISFVFSPALQFCAKPLSAFFMQFAAEIHPLHWNGTNFVKLVD